MSKRSLVFQTVLCACGIHQKPPPRDPPGPIAAYCPCCGKGVYCYGAQANRQTAIAVLLVPNYPRVIGTIAAQYR